MGGKVLDIAPAPLPYIAYLDPAKYTPKGGKRDGRKQDNKER
jgi:hypothetical protein